MTINSTAEVQSDNIGEGTSIAHFCLILKGAVIGQNCDIKSWVLIENEVLIGDNVVIMPGVQIYDGITIEDAVFIGPNVTFTNDLIPRPRRYSAGWREDVSRWAKTFISKGAVIGGNSTIVAGIIIGEFAFVRAGSLVTKDVPAYSVWFGNPARQTGFVTELGILLDMSLESEDGRKFRFEDGRLIEKR